MALKKNVEDAIQGAFAMTSEILESTSCEDLKMIDITIRKTGVGVKFISEEESINALNGIVTTTEVSNIKFTEGEFF